ncbi:hypothetical protein BH10PAT1_BH10PAT1_6590 [soil metagenome]
MTILKIFLISLLGILSGILLGVLLIFYIPNKSSGASSPVNLKQIIQPAKKQVLGFLPYWFLSKAKDDYSEFITTLNYFSLTPDIDGTILKYTSPGESEPGYYALTAGAADKFLSNAKAKNIKLSLTVFSGDQESINRLLDDPIPHAGNMMNDLVPIMNQYGFTDLNLDIESIQNATPESQLKFASFVKEVRSQITTRNLNYTLSIDIAPVDFIRDTDLIKPILIESLVDKIILMAYDFHSPSSYVTGPVAPLYGASTVAEFDTNVGVEKALQVTSADKILLGLPFYGYSWETLGNFERAAIVPSSALIMGNSDVEDLLNTCASCSAQFDNLAKEKYIIYKNESGTFQQIFYPDADSVKAKTNFVNENGLGGIAIWALGYEGSNNILNPIQNFLSHH